MVLIPVPLGKDAMVTPRTAAILGAGLFFLGSTALMCLGVHQWLIDRALANPAKSATVNAKVIEYQSRRGGMAKYQFTTEDGVSVIDHGSIDRWDYGELAAGRADSISVRYVKDDPRTNAPSRGSSWDVSGDVWQVIFFAFAASVFGATTWRAWNKRKE